MRLRTSLRVSQFLLTQLIFYIIKMLWHDYLWVISIWFCLLYSFVHVWLYKLVAHMWQVPFRPMQECLWQWHLSWCWCNKYILWRHKNCWFKHWLIYFYSCLVFFFFFSLFAPYFMLYILAHICLLIIEFLHFCFILSTSCNIVSDALFTLQAFLVNALLYFSKIPI